MHGLKDKETARLFAEGWLLYYNYLRPHESLRCKTPVQVAGVKYPYRNWQDIVVDHRVDTINQVNATRTLEFSELPKGTRYMVIAKVNHRHIRLHDSINSWIDYSGQQIFAMNYEISGDELFNLSIDDIFSKSIKLANI